MTPRLEAELGYTSRSINLEMQRVLETKIRLLMDSLLRRGGLLVGVHTDLKSAEVWCWAMLYLSRDGVAAS